MREILEQWDEDVERILSGKLDADNLAGISNGFYTLTSPDGTHRTFRVHTKRATARVAAGQRVISLLVGPVNTEDYETVGVVRKEGIGLWKKHQGGRVEKWVSVLWAIAGGGVVAGWDMLVSKRCRVCNRELTDPESIETELGPSCRKRMRRGG